MGAPGRKGRNPIPIDLTRVEGLAERGLKDWQIAAALEISDRTLEARKATNDAFVAAIKRGRARGGAAVVDSLFKVATGIPRLDAKGKQIGWRVEPKFVAAIYLSKVLLGFRETVPTAQPVDGSEAEALAAYEAYRGRFAVAGGDGASADSTDTDAEGGAQAPGGDGSKPPEGEKPPANTRQRRKPGGDVRDKPQGD